MLAIKKIQEKQKKLNSLPPILRPKNKKSRELAAVTHFQQKIRPDGLWTQTS